MRNYHFPNVRKGIASAGAIMSGLVGLVMGTGAAPAVQNIRDFVHLTGHVPYAWFTAENVGRFWWAPILVCVAFLLWGFLPRRKPEEKIEPFPFQVTAMLHHWNYRDGTVIEGIEWKEGYSHSTVTIANTSARTVENVTAMLGPDQPIRQSAVSAPFGGVTVGPPFDPPTLTIFSYLPETGDYEAIPLGMQVASCPIHRLFCERFPPGTAVVVTMATARPLEDPEHPAADNFHKERHDPKGVAVNIAFERNGEPVQQVFNIPFAITDTEDMKSPSVQPQRRSPDGGETLD